MSHLRNYARFARAEAKALEEKREATAHDASEEERAALWVQIIGTVATLKWLANQLDEHADLEDER